MEQKKEKKSKRWTAEEDALLLRSVKAFPQNLHKCFMLVSEQIDRTPQGVSSHWYTVLSKRDDVLAFFTASAKHVSKNRKNGEGEHIESNVWKRFVRIIKDIFK